MDATASARLMTTVTSGAADAIAHELGHHIDYPRSGDDRRGTNEQQEVKEGMADMFQHLREPAGPRVRVWDRRACFGHRGVAAAE